MQNATPRRSTLVRAGWLWLLSNLGGTLWLAVDFSLDRFADYPIALMAGTLAALVSLAMLPLLLPFIALLRRVRPGWFRRTVALLGVVLLFLLANELLLGLLPIDSLGSLLGLSRPYLGAALLTVLWLYRPGRWHRQVARPRRPTPLSPARWSVQVVAMAFLP